MTAKGEKASDETKKKMSLAHKGKILSKETKQKMSLARIGRGLNETTNPFTTHTKETRKIISAKLKGKKQDERSIENKNLALLDRVRRGAENKSAPQPVEIDGVKYKSVSAAARAHKVDPKTITYRCKSKTEVFKNWKFLPFPNPVKMDE